MRGYVQSRSKGSWTIWVELDRDPSSGRRRRKTATFHGNKKQAQAALRELLVQLDSGLPVDNSKVTVKAYLESWLSEVGGTEELPADP